MKIIFLCAANVFRSQIAEAVFNKICKENNLKHKARSAALIYNNEPMHLLVIKALKEIGINISKNKSKRATPELIENSDLIILMHSNLKGHLINILHKPVEIWNIEDIHAWEDEFEKYPDIVKTRNQIQNKISELLKTLEDK